MTLGNILLLVAVAALLCGADARKNFDDVKKDLDDKGSGSSTSGFSGTTGSGHFGATVQCSSEAFAATYTGFVDSYIQAGTLPLPLTVCGWDPNMKHKNAQSLPHSRFR
eukprot:jgi/Ulvmu1/1562/UM110_0025.1